MEIGGAILALRVFDRTSVVLGDFLVAETEAQNWDGEVVEALVVQVVLVIGREGGTAGEYYSLAFREPNDGVFGLEDLRQNVQAPDLGRDEVRVLPSEIHHPDDVVRH